MTRKEITLFVKIKVQRGNPSGALRTLSKRIAESYDGGLADTVYYHQWMTYGDAVAIRDLLSAHVNSQAA